jgi:uncharacterized membrane protein
VWLEPLEDRILLDAGLPASIVVGRTLSAYFTGDVRDHQETITYTVYNEQANPVSGVLLTDTLEPGVTVQSASQLPDQSGSDLAWSLGTIAGYDRASVTLTVALGAGLQTPPPSSPLQLDTGAHAFAMLDAGAVSNATPAATLRPGSVDPNLLASTPDANTTDPFIQEEAAKLNYNSQQIFDFLHFQISYNSYVGSLRGARGTLWSSAGNATDVASLGVALERASGIPAKYVSGTLSESQAQQLILSMFPASYQTVGYIPPGTQVSDPANDPQLLTETESHYWFQFDAGSGMEDADSLMAGATIGQTFTTATGAFTEVPDGLRQKTEIKINAEMYSQASAAFAGNGFNTVTVLDQTFNDVDLVGRPITVGHFVNSSSIGGITFSSKTNTYSPYIQVGDAAYPDPSHDVVIRGQDYQEYFTNFPLSNQVLTGLFLNMTLSGPGATVQSYERTLVDRIGYAARQGLTAPENLTVNPSDPPVIEPYDLLTLVSDSSLHESNLIEPFETHVTKQQEQATQLSLSRRGSDSELSATIQNYLVSLGRSELIQFLASSGQQTGRLAKTADVVAYYDRPRVTIFSSQFSPATDSFSFAIDLRNNQMRTLSGIEQSVTAPKLFNMARGFLDNVLEQSFVPTVPGSVSVGTINILQQAVSENVPFVTLSNQDLTILGGLGVSADVKARISAAIDQGNVVIVPARNVTIGGIQTISWVEVDPTTGELSGVLENGIMSGQSEEAADYGFVSVQTGKSYPFSVIRGGLGGPTPGPGTPTLRVLDTRLLQKIEDEAAEILRILFESDPPLPSLLVNTGAPEGAPTNIATSRVTNTASLGLGTVTAEAQMMSSEFVGEASVSWDSTAANVFQAQTLILRNASILHSNGELRGSGTATLSAGSFVAASVSGNVHYSLSGRGRLSFYGPAEANLGVGGNWADYTATVTGDVLIRLTVPNGALTLNGQALPAGSYTLSTNSATFTGSGSTTSPNFAGSASITTTNGTVNFGPGRGTVTVGGSPLDSTNGVTLTGYTGSITVAAGGGVNLERVTLDGNADNILTVSATPDTLTTDQNTPVTFHANVNTSLADTYNLTSQAPPGWTVTIDSNGNVTATPAPGLQSGTYPIQVIAQSTTNPDLVAQTTVHITITPTQPGMTFAVNPDPIFTVPYNGAQLPTAFQAVVHNTGPTADAYNLTFSNLPAGWTVLNSGTSVTVPAGQTGILGVYLQPSGGLLPPPGTTISFTVTATSTSDPTITATQTVSFTMPVVHAVTVTSNNPTLDIVPGSEWGFSVTLQNGGNVTETIHPTAAIPAGLNLPGGFFNFFDVTLAPGQSVTETKTATADPKIPLNSTQTVTVTATYGPADSPLTQTVQILVQMVVAGAQYVGDTAIAAAQAGRTDLANRLSDLSTALTNLFLDPTSAIYKSEALANFDSVAAQIADDPFLAENVFNLPYARDQLVNAATAAQVQYAVNVIGGALNIAWIIPDEAKHSFTVQLSPNSAVAQPQAPVYYNVVLRNTGTQTTTYDLSVSNLPAGVRGTFSRPSITLAPGQAVDGGPDGVTLAVTETGDSLIAAGFNVTATAEGAGEIQLSTPGTVTLRPAFVSVPEVDATPSFSEPGGPVDVSAKVLNAVNQQEQALASYTVAGADGNVVFTSRPVPLTLAVQTSLVTVDLGSFDTTGLAPGNYAITVIVTDPSGKPIPGATGQGTVFLGSPVTASLSVTPTTSLPGFPTVTNTLQVTAQTPFPVPLTQLGQVQTTPTGTTVALDGSLAYVAGTNGIDIVDISDPANPQVENAFAGDRIVKGGLTVVRRVGNELVVGSTVETHSGSSQFGFTLLIYTLDNPLAPTFVSQTPINYAFLGDLLVNGTTVLVPTGGAGYFAGFLDSQFGSLLSLDVSNPAKPVLSNVLFNDHGPPFGGDTNEHGGTLVNNHIAYIAGSTSTTTFASTPAGVGRVLVVDYSDPAKLTVLGEVDIPGTVHALDVAVQGNRALVLGSTGDWRTEVDNIAQAGLTGNLTLTVLDISDPLSPKVVGTTLVTDGTSAAASAASKISVLPLGNGLFAVSEANINGKSQILLVDPSNPNSLVVTALPTPAPVNEMAVSGDLLYTTSSAGLGIYRIGSVVGEPMTVSVRVPNKTGVAVVPNSFNVPPTQIIHGTDYDTLVWNRELAFGEAQPTFTWQTTVSSLLPGESRDVTLGGTVDFVHQGTAGTVMLPPTAVSGVHIISLDPASQTVRPGDTVTFHLTLHNPTPFNEGFSLFVKGVPANWVHMPSAVEIEGNGSTDVTLQIAPTVTAELGDYGFQVTASYGFVDPTFANSGSDTVQGTLTVAGQPAARPYLEAHGVVASLTPAQASAGQGTSATYTVQLINTGSADDTFTLAVQGLPTGVTAAFAQSSVDVPPGVSNFRDVTLTLTSAAGTPPGDISFQVVATSTAVATVIGTATGTLSVLADGVSVSLDPPAGAPGDTLQMTVTNTGRETDKFDLALTGPAALVAVLPVKQMTLAPGASEVIPITTGATNFAVPGPLTLTASATSEIDPSVRATVSAVIQVPSFTGLAVQLQPASTTLAAPGTTSFLLLVQNLGNTEEAYTATISGINGPAIASLVGLDGQPAQSIPVFRLPGLSSGAILLQVDLTDFGTGTVTIQIHALDGSDTATATATVISIQPLVPPNPSPRLPPPPTPPVLLPPPNPFPQLSPLASPTSAGDAVALPIIKGAVATSPAAASDNGLLATFFPETQSAQAASADFSGAKFSNAIAASTVFGSASPTEGPRADYLGDEDIVLEEGMFWWQPAALETSEKQLVASPDLGHESFEPPLPFKAGTDWAESLTEMSRQGEDFCFLNRSTTAERNDAEWPAIQSSKVVSSPATNLAFGAALAGLFLGSVVTPRSQRALEADSRRLQYFPTSKKV